MKRISTATRWQNLFGAGKDGFRDGDMANGFVATDFEAAWCNGVQEELASVIEAAGIALNGNDLAQLLKAIRVLMRQAGAPGDIFFTAKAAPPMGALKGNGGAVSRTAYVDLFNEIGTFYGAGDGSTTFNVPDLRGLFPRFLDDGRGYDPARVRGSFQKGTLVGGYDNDDINNNISFLANRANIDYGSDPVNYGLYPGVDGRFANGIDSTGGGTSFPFYSVSRPMNIALLGCIRY